MGRNKTSPCRLIVWVEEIRNLPKVNKGSGGADPFVVLEVLDNADQVLVGGDRELYCAGCKSKVIKKALEGYVTEKYEFGVHSAMVRSGARMRIRVMDFKPSPEVAKGIAFVDVVLKDLTHPSSSKDNKKFDLMALGHIVTTFGNKTEHGEVLIGYKNPTAPAYVTVALELQPPAFHHVDGVPEEHQISAWEFHLKSPEEQNAYDEAILGMKMQLERDAEDAIRRKREEAAHEERMKFKRRMESRVKEPTKRTNWKELQDLMTNELMRREWGYTMEKVSGVGGWRRIAGTGMQDKRDDEAERDRVVKYLTYKASEKREDDELKDFVSKQNSERMAGMTDHLSEWADPGGREAVTLHPGSRSLGASVCHVVPTANLSARTRLMKQERERPKSRGSSRGGARSADTPGTGDGEAGQLVWKDGITSAERISYLQRDSSSVGFDEFKEAVLRVLGGGQGKNAWRNAVEVALQRSVSELGMPLFFTGHRLSQERVQLLGKLSQDLQAATASRPMSGTGMISHIDFEDLVQKLQEDLEECEAEAEELQNEDGTPVDAVELSRRKVGISYLEKLLEDAEKNLERHLLRVAAQSGTSSALADSQPSSPARRSSLLVEGGSGVSRHVRNVKDDNDIGELTKTGVQGLKPDGSILRNVSVSRTATPTMLTDGLHFTTPAPDVGGRKGWTVERINGRDWLYPHQVPTGDTGSSNLTTRLSTQQVGEMRGGEAVQSIQGDSLRAATRKLWLGKQPPAVQEEEEENVKQHSYVPPANDLWGSALKISRGKMFNELDMIHNIRSLSLGGSISLGPTTNRPRPDTSSTMIRRTPMTNHAMITVHPDRPGGESLTMEARFAVFGRKSAFSGVVVNAPTPPDNSSMFANHAEAGGKIVLFDLRLSDTLLPTDLGFICARQAESAGAVAAIFILESDEIITAAGVGKGINPIQCPILCLKKTDGGKLRDWIQPPLRFNEPYITVETWVPQWLLPEETPDGGLTEAKGGEDKVQKLVSNELVSFWEEALSADDEGKEWMQSVQLRVARELGIDESTLLMRGMIDPEDQKMPVTESVRVPDVAGGPHKTAGHAVATATSSRDNLVFGMDSEQNSVAGDSESGMEEFSAVAGTTLRMTRTQHDVVEIRKGVAVIISNATNILPRADGASRDLPGLERDVERLEGVLSDLGFKVFAPQKNRNADEVLHFLRKIKRGFDAGGSLIGHDSLLVIFTGHTDGQSIECAVDGAGQVGSLGIQLLMELFNDNSCPGLKGKLKMFILGLSFGHPVQSPSLRHDDEVSVSAEDDHGTRDSASSVTNGKSKSTLNVLNSTETGGSARVYSSTCQFSVPVLKTDWLQSSDAFLRDEAGAFQGHVSISYRGVPYSGTFWTRTNPAGKGEVTIDLGKVVEGIDTFAAFQQPFDDGKCTSIWVRHAKSTDAGDVPPSNEWDWVNVTDTDGNLDIPLFEGPGDGAAFVSGSIMGASRVFKTEPFTTRWLCIEFRNDNTHGTQTGVGLRQIKAFASPNSSPVPSHTPGKPTWVENPAEGAGGPALNRVGPDSIYPLYQMPVYAFAGKPKAMDGAIGLSADYSLLCYSVPVGGISHTPASGSHLLSSMVRLLEASHHKHTFQDMLSTLLQHMVDDSCSRYGPGDYREQVRLLQRRCDTEDFPVMLSLGRGRAPAPGMTGPEDFVVSQLGTLRYRHYEFDVAEPRNSVRDTATNQRAADALSLLRPKYNLKFHPRLKSGLWDLRSEGTTLVKSHTGPKCVCALALALPSSAKKYTWQFVVGTVSVIGGTSLSVPELCIGVVARSAARRLNLEEYQLGDDTESWGIQTGSLTLYKNHAGVSQRLIGVSFGAGDVITCILDIAAGTLSFCVNGNEETVPPFTGLPGAGVVPAVSAGGSTDACVTIANCQTW